MTRKELQNLFPPVPGHFLDRIDQTMEEIEAMNKKSVKRIRRVSHPVLIAAVLIVALAGTALAMAIHSCLLKDTLKDLSVEELAEQVVDMTSVNAQDGFSLSLDEYIRNGDNLFLSCTLKVPEDGKTYLAGIMQPLIDGKIASYHIIRYFDNQSSMIVYPLGGAFPASRSLLLPLNAESADDSISLDLKAVFLSTDRPIVSQRVDVENRQPETLYAGGDSDPEIDLMEYSEISELAEHKEGVFYAEEWLTNGIAPEAVGRTSLVDYVTTRELVIPELKEQVEGELVYNDVKEHSFTWRDMSITVEEIRMTHFDLELKLRLERDGGFARQDVDLEQEWSDRVVGIPGYDFMFLGLAYPDGSPVNSYEDLSGTVNCGMDEQDDGSLTYTFEGEGIFPLSTFDRLLIVPEYWSPAEEEYCYDTRLDAGDIIATLEFTTDDSRVSREAEQKAIRDCKPGDAAQTVYASDQGRYYHCKADCGGMRNSKAISIEEALAAGKPACPICIGGHDSRVNEETYNSEFSGPWSSDN